MKILALRAMAMLLLPSFTCFYWAFYFARYHWFRKLRLRYVLEASHKTKFFLLKILLLIESSCFCFSWIWEGYCFILISKAEACENHWSWKPNLSHMFDYFGIENGYNRYINKDGLDQQCIKVMKNFVWESSETISLEAALKPRIYFFNWLHSKWRFFHLPLIIPTSYYNLSSSFCNIKEIAWK